MRLIDADVIEKIIRKRVYAIEVEDILSEIANAPTIEPCEDAISRADALKFIDEKYNEGRHLSEYEDGRNSMNEAIYAGIESLPSVAPSRSGGEWIPCSERLPNGDGTYLVTYEWVGKTGTKHIEIEGIDFEHGRWDCHDYELVFGKVTAWMPLPEPYKESE